MEGEHPQAADVRVRYHQIEEDQQPCPGLVDLLDTTKQVSIKSLCTANSAARAADDDGEAEEDSSGPTQSNSIRKQPHSFQCWDYGSLFMRAGRSQGILTAVG